MDRFRFSCLIAAVFFYALWGSPTPDHPGWPEILTGALLVLAAGLHSPLEVLHFDGRGPAWRGAAQMLLIYGFSVALLAAALRGQGAGLVLRDILPFLFLLLPLFLADLFGGPGRTKKLAWAVVFLGCVFAARSVFAREEGGELYYFANMPGVLFAAVMLPAWGMRTCMKRFSPRHVFYFCAALALATLPLAAMALTLQRAGIGFFMLAFGGLMLWGFTKLPARFAVLGLLCLGAALPFVHALAEQLGMLAQKNGLVGFNMRGQEFAAVWDEISVSPLFQFFGAGWGGTFESPAVAGIRVNYTHSLPSSLLLKTGLCGLALAGLYLAGLAGAWARLLPRNPFIAAALAGPLLIDVFFYASFKSFDFGLILLLLAAAAKEGEKAPGIAMERRVRYVKT